MDKVETTALLDNEVSTNTTAEVTETVEKVEEVAVTEETAVEEFKMPEKLQGKTLEEVAKMYQNAEKKIHEKFEKAPEEYVLPEEFSLAKDTDFVAMAKELNITQSQMKVMADAVIGSKVTEAELAASERTKYVESNKKRIAEGFGDELESRKVSIEDMLHKYAGSDLTKELKDRGGLDNAVILEVLNKLHGKVLKNTMTGSNYVERSLTSDEKRESIPEMLSGDMYEAWKNPAHPKHSVAKAKLQRILGK